MALTTKVGDVTAGAKPLIKVCHASVMTMACRKFAPELSPVLLSRSHGATRRATHVIRGGSSQDEPRHPKGPTRRCYLPVLTGLAGFRRAGPDRHRLPCERRGRDSNPRDGFSAYTLSRRA